VIVGVAVTFGRDTSSLNTPPRSLLTAPYSPTTMLNPFGARSLRRGYQLSEPHVQFDTVRGEGPAVISHAHSDHVPESRRTPVITTHPTADLLRSRGHTGQIVALDYDRWEEFSGWRLKLLPAGHILGSAQILIERADGLRLLYTGDMKTRRGRTAEPARFEHAHDLIIESTFGQPFFRFPPDDEVAARMVEWARQCLADDAKPVFTGYALGKAQEIMSILSEAGIPMLVHSTIWSVNEVYRRYGYDFGDVVRFSADRRLEPRAWVLPPHLRGRILARSPEARVCYVSGWALLETRRDAVGAELMAPLSDHADYYDLLDAIRIIAPDRVWAVHGPSPGRFARDVQRTLGIEAMALEEWNGQESFW
jgi:DNA ligase 1